MDKELWRTILAGLAIAQLFVVALAAWQISQNGLKIVAVTSSCPY